MTETSPPRIVVVEDIQLRGFDSDAALELEQFVRAVVGGSGELCGELGLSDDVHLTVLSAADYNVAVDRVRAEYGIACGKPYQSVRTAVQGGGIMLWAKGRSPAEATVLLNVNCAPDTLSRFYLFAHEFGHVLSRAARPPAEPPQSTVRSVRASLEGTADALLEEIRADRVAAWACGVALRTEHGEPVELADAMGPDFIRAAERLLECIRRFAGEDVDIYRRSGEGLDLLVSRGNSLLSELLIVLTHLVAFFDSARRIETLPEILGRGGAFRAYVAQDWDVFVAALTSRDTVIARRDIPRVFENILARLGLRVRQLPKGDIQVDVDAPVVCPEA